MNDSGQQRAMRISLNCLRATGVPVTTKSLRSDLIVDGMYRKLIGWQMTIDYLKLGGEVSVREAQSKVISWAKKQYPQMSVSGGSSNLVVYLKRRISGL